MRTLKFLVGNGKMLLVNNCWSKIPFLVIFCHPTGTVHDFQYYWANITKKTPEHNNFSHLHRKILFSPKVG